MISLRNITMDYAKGPRSVPALRGVSLDVATGVFGALVGPSGSGKSTLMNIIGLLDRPTSGDIRLNGQVVIGWSPTALAEMRNRLIGFVFQSFHLLPQFTIVENVALPLIYRGISRRQREKRAAVLLDRVGLGAFLDRRPNELSGGQRQRVAIARALVGTPRLLLADEPTGNLDSRSAAEIMGLLFELNHDLGLTILMVTHDTGLAQRCPRRFVMRDGVLDRQETAAALPSETLQ